jgi:hypothetical protein
MVVTPVRVEDGAEARTKQVMSGASSGIRILAVDDHLVVRDGIADLIGVQPDMAVIADAANGRDCSGAVSTKRWPACARGLRTSSR